MMASTQKRRGYRQAQRRRRGNPLTAMADGDRRRAAGRRRRRLVRAGHALMAAGAVILVTHWLGHLGAFGAQPSSLADLLVGYPAGAVVFLLGAVLAGQ